MSQAGCRERECCCGCGNGEQPREEPWHGKRMRLERPLECFEGKTVGSRRTGALLDQTVCGRVGVVAVVVVVMVVLVLGGAVVVVVMAVVMGWLLWQEVVGVAVVADAVVQPW